MLCYNHGSILQGEAVLSLLVHGECKAHSSLALGTAAADYAPTAAADRSVIRVTDRNRMRFSFPHERACAHGARCYESAFNNKPRHEIQMVDRAAAQYEPSVM